MAEQECQLCKFSNPGFLTAKEARVLNKIYDEYQQECEKKEDPVHVYLNMQRRLNVGLRLENTAKFPHRFEYEIIETHMEEHRYNPPAKRSRKVMERRKEEGRLLAEEKKPCRTGHEFIILGEFRPSSQIPEMANETTNSNQQARLEEKVEIPEITNTEQVFNYDIDVDFKCSICLELFYQPVITNDCQHTFCKRCLDDFLDGSESVPCPLCRCRITAVRGYTEDTKRIDILREKYSIEYAKREKFLPPEKPKKAKLPETESGRWSVPHQVVLEAIGSARSPDSWRQSPPSPPPLLEENDEAQEINQSVEEQPRFVIYQATLTCDRCAKTEHPENCIHTTNGSDTINPARGPRTVASARNLHNRFEVRTASDLPDEIAFVTPNMFEEIPERNVVPEIRVSRASSPHRITLQNILLTNNNNNDSNVGIPPKLKKAKQPKRRFSHRK